MLLALSVFAQQPAHADTPPGVSVYTFDNFAAAAPDHALDMVSRLPGFVIVEADDEVRGYAGAQGNVLIDGVRPTSKHEDIKALLKRIPVGSVERIELIRGGLAGIDMAGYAIVANVVRKQVAVSAMTLQGGLIAAEDGWVEPLARLEYGRRRDGLALQLALSVEPELDDATGRGQIHAVTADGELREDSNTRSRESIRLTQVNANWQRPLAAGLVELNAALSGERKQENVRIDTVQPDPRHETASEDEDIDSAEIGARFSRLLDDRSGMQLMASQRRVWQDTLSLSRENGENERFEENTDSGETIARIDLTHAASADLNLVAIVEGASNFLDSRAELMENGAQSPLPPGSDVSIEENRGEASLGATWQLANAWRLDAGFGIETSTIRQTGDSPLKRHFVYNKPHLAVDWKAGANNRFRLALAREIGQLDFGDFVASAALDRDDISAGNAELQPDQSWRSSITWEYGFWDDGALVLTWTHDRISDVVDRVLVTVEDEDDEDDAIFDAPGNIGDGSRDSVAVELSTSLDRLGLSGFHFAVAMLWTESAVTDPVTGETRSISGEPPREGELSLTRILPISRWSWGVSVDLAERETKYEFDKITTEYEEHSWELFTERRIGNHWRLRAEINDPFGREFSEHRREYEGPRAGQSAAEVERREHRMPAQFMLSLRRSTDG